MTTNFRVYISLESEQNKGPHIDHPKLYFTAYGSPSEPLTTSNGLTNSGHYFVEAIQYRLVYLSNPLQMLKLSNILLLR